MKRSLFLHYGPGGNSFVEKKVLSDLADKIYFWDQPKTKNIHNPYIGLVGLCEQELKKMSSPQSIIAHSFGCDLAASIMKSNPSFVSKTILISPLRSVPIGFINLAKKLLAKQNLKPLAEALLFAENTANKLNMEANIFWGLVSQVATHPDYNSSFWHSVECMTDYFSLAAEAPAFDAEEWQALIHDYLFLQKQNNYEILKNTNTHAILGADDPYLTVADHEYWKNLLGKDNVTIVENAGHFPHIEQPSCLVKLL